MMQKNESIDEIQKVWQWVSRQHDGQKYGGQNPGQKVEYLNHIGSVVWEILYAVKHTQNMNEDLAVKCAMLHDTIEDTACTYEMIKEYFGEKVAAGVLALTKNEQLADKYEKMRDSLQRIQTQPKEIWAVKMADRIANLQAPPYYWNEEKIKAYIEEALLIYDTLKEGNAYLAKRLYDKIQAYHQFLSK